MVNYNSYNQGKDIQTVSDIIGSYSIWQFNVFAFQFVHAFILPVFNQGISLYDIDTNYECLESGNEEAWTSNFSTNPYIDELGFNRQQCRSSDCSEFSFTVKKYDSSLVKSLNLTCEKDWLKYFASASYQLGCLISVLFYFILCKRFGRAMLIRVSMFIELAATCSTCFLHNFYSYVISRFLLGIGSFGVFLLSFILLMEIVSTQIRSNVCIIVQLGWTLGNLVLSLAMTFFTVNYEDLERSIIIVQVVLLLYSFLLQESPKWELLNGHYKKAEETLIKAGKGFYKLSSHEIKNRLMLLREHLIEQEVNQKFNFSNMNGHRKNYRLVFKALSLVFSWFVCKLIYFTISYYPELFTKKNGDFLEQNSLSQSIVELIAFLLTYLMIRYVSKRIYILVFSLFFVIIAIFGELLFFKLNYFEDDIKNYAFKLGFVLIMKFGVSLVIQFLLLFTGECFNENLHPKIYGYAMSFGCLGSCLAAFAPLFIDYFNLTTTLITLGSLAILNLFALIWMPELIQTSANNSTQKLNSDMKGASDLTMNLEDAVEFSFKIEE